MKPQIVTLEYDGMGIGVEAYIKVNNKLVTIIGTSIPSKRKNEITIVAAEAAAKAVKRYLRSKK